MNIKEQYQRFREWQRRVPQPVNHHSDEVVVCQNCGTEFSDNFCPRCGQRAGLGRVGWKAAHQSVAFLWGMDSRSLPYSLWQLLLRPGYLIRDYISGHLQVSYQPVKMLIVLGIFIALLEHLFGWQSVNSDPLRIGLPYVDSVLAWMDENEGWGMLLASSLMILPNWLLFRFAPRYPRHTIPEGFFIQVFLGSLMLLLSPLDYLLGDGTGTVIEIAFAVWAYHQLFGYSLWSTLWRLYAALMEILYALCLILIGQKFFEKTVNIERLLAFVIVMLVLLLLDAAFLYVCYYIGKRTSKR